MQEKRGRFYVFEGIDGSGKGTQAKEFVSRLFDYSKFNHVVLTREPYNSREIRRRLKEEQDAYENADKMAELYIEDRKEHLRRLILPSIALGMHVVSDRYKHSTIAYQATQGLDMDLLIAKHEGLLISDLTFFIDVPVEVAMERMKKQEEGREKKFEADKDFQQTLKENYFRAIHKLKARGENILIIDGNRSQELIANEIWTLQFK